MVKPIKIELVDELTGLLQRARGVIFATHEGIVANDAVMLRRYLREKGLAYYVRKNTLARIAMRNAGYEAGLSMLNRSTAIVISEQEPEAPFRAVFDKFKEYENLQVKGGIYEGRIVDGKTAGMIAKLGTKEQMLSTLLGTLNAPVSNFVGALAAVLRKLVGTLDAIRAQKSG